MNNRFSSPTEWVQFYQHPLTGVGLGQASSVADATVVTTTITPPIIPTSGTSNTGHLSPEGRVSKPARRRRASRAAPTTLVNTDTTNFRAMVQQFTGVSNPSITFGGHNNDAQNIDFRTMNGQSSQNANMNIMPQGGRGYRSSHYQQQQQQQGYMFSSQNRGDGFNNTRPSLEASDGFLMENTSSSQMFQRSSSSHNNRNNGYIQ